MIRNNILFYKYILCNKVLIIKKKKNILLISTVYAGKIAIIHIFNITTSN